jgi:hypothetical protein
MFEWNANKARINLKKHGVSFEEAATVFEDERALEVEDSKHSTELEPRFLKLGNSIYSRILLVVFTLRGRLENEQVITRIISARQASHKERSFYENADDLK